MDTRQVVFVNGPPRSGKDTLAECLVNFMPGYKLVKFAKILKERTHALYGHPNLPHDHFESCKGRSNPIFHGLSPREAYINVSERLMKPVHGKKIYGEMLARDMKREDNEATGFVISDSGFQHEAQPVIEHFGADNCILIRVHAHQRGCTFLGDSRSYVELPVESLDLYNNASIPEFLRKVPELIVPLLQARMYGA